MTNDIIIILIIIIANGCHLGFLLEKMGENERVNSQPKSKVLLELTQNTCFSLKEINA